jgi:HK97 family phage portal protein
MRIFGLPVPFTADWRADREKALSPVSTRGSFWGWIHESFSGAWQQNVEVDTVSILKFPAIYACVTLISGDIGKLRLRLMSRQSDMTWSEIPNPASPLFSYPNEYQTRIQFIEQWVISILLYGNTYVWKERNSAGQVVALHVLDPCRVKVLVSELGDVFYQLDQDDLAGVAQARIAVPASDIIHDRYKPLYHPLVGISPISAAGLAATLGQSILNNSASFFENGSRPGGLLIAPGPITKEKAQELKELWDSRYSGTNAGKVAVLGDGLQYVAMSVKAVDAQLLEQLKLSNELVAMCFHIPAFMIGAGPIPTYQNAQVLSQIYYAQCLQTLIENIEASLDKGLELGAGLGCEFDLDDLLRMDSKTQVETLVAAVGGGIMPPNIALKKQNLPPQKGGDSIYLQQQNYSLQALAERDATNPLALPAPAIEGDGAQDVQATAFNGAQVTALLAIIEAVTSGVMPPEAAAAAISAAFPALSDAEIAAIIDPLRNFEAPAPDPPTPANDSDERMALAVEKAWEMPVAA